MSRMSLANLTCVLGPDTCFCHAHARAYLCQLADVVFLHSHIVAGLSLQTGALRGFLHAAALKRSQNFEPIWKESTFRSVSEENVVRTVPQTKDSDSARTKDRGPGGLPA